MDARALTRKRYAYRQFQRERGAMFDIDLVDAEPARQLVLAAKNARLTFDEMARKTGLPRSRIGELVWYNGGHKRIWRKTERAIFKGLSDLDDRDYGDRQRVPITVEPLMIKCLAAQGWPRHELKKMLVEAGVGNGDVLYHVQAKGRKTSMVCTLRQVYWLVKVIGDKPGPSPHLAKRMQHQGVFPLRHYTPEGKLNVRTLSPDQQRWVQ